VPAAPLAASSAPICLETTSQELPRRVVCLIATTYDEGRTWVTVNATPNDPVTESEPASGSRGGSGQNGDRNLLDLMKSLSMTRPGSLRIQRRLSYRGLHQRTPGGSRAFMRVARQFWRKAVIQPV